MDFKLLIVYYTIVAVTAAADQFSNYNQDDEYADIESIPVDPSLLSLLSPHHRQSGLENFVDTNSDSSADETKDFGAAISLSKPSLGLGFSLLKPQIEVLHLLEAFIKLKGLFITSVYALINENYGLIKAVLNLIISKAPHLLTFSLKGIGIFRKIIDFALNLFTDWNVGISSPVYDVPIY